MKLRAIFILIAAVFGQTVVVFGQNGHTEKIDELLSMLNHQQQFNGSVIIAENGKVTYKRSYGIRSEATKQKVDENTVFELASISKQFTSMGIVLLKERGKLSYDDKLTNFFPELHEYKDVTVRNLLTHTSGIPDYIAPWYLSLFDKTKIYKNKDLVDFLVTQKIKLSFVPGTKFQYSNTGYVLLATIIEKVSGRSFADFLQKSIFKPLGMRNTFVYTRRLTPQKITNYAYGYVFSPKESRYMVPDSFVDFVVFLDGIYGDGNISSSAADLLKWDQALRAGKLISKESMKEMYTPTILPDKTSSNYGFGWFTKTDRDGSVSVFHGGGFPGYKAYIERQLSKNKTLIILQNYNDVAVPSYNIFEILNDKPVTKMYRKQIDINVDLLAKHAGEYKDTGRGAS